MSYRSNSARLRSAAAGIFALVAMTGLVGTAAAGSFSEYLFPGPDNRGPYAPLGGVIIDTNGKLWGTTYDGGGNTSDGGTIFGLIAPPTGQQQWDDSSGYFSFSPDINTGYYTHGKFPLGLTYDGLDAGRAWDRTSPLYGWTDQGGSNNDDRNVVFLYGGPCSFNVLHTFHDFAVGNGGFGPRGLTTGPDGSLYGVINEGPTPSDSGAVFRITLTRKGCGAASYGIIYTFADGNQPTGAMTFGPDGALYLVASDSIFKLQPNASKPRAAWRRTTLYTFTESNHGPSGRNLVFGTDGAIYAADMGGGGDTTPGTIYRLRSHVNNKGKTVWGRDTLYSFAAEDPHGTNPTAVYFGPDGVLYGITKDNGFADGSVFKVTPQAGNPRALPWNMTVLHTFTGTDGSRPAGTLAFGSNGAIYGTTFYGSPDYPSNYWKGYAYELVP